jgi:hypothetical protein
MAPCEECLWTWEILKGIEKKKLLTADPHIN